jgi:hypothetical protein
MAPQACSGSFHSSSVGLFKIHGFPDGSRQTFYIPFFRQHFIVSFFKIFFFTTVPQSIAIFNLEDWIKRCSLCEHSRRPYDIIIQEACCRRFTSSDVTLSRWGLCCND